MLRNALKAYRQAWRPKSGLLALLLIALSLPGCATPGTPATEKVQAPEQCLVLGQDLPLLTDSTLAGAFRNHLEVVTLYWELAERHRCLVQFERER